jgi:hypothetical protein
MNVERLVVAHKLHGTTLYKLLFIGLAISCFILGTIFGVAALFGANTVTWNHQQLHGVGGLIASILICEFLAVAFTGIVGSLAVFGLWLLSLWRPVSLRISVVESQASEA